MKKLTAALATRQETEIGQHTGGRTKLNAGEKNERAAGYAGLQIEYTK
jgi:hypothetical protein